MTRREKQTIYMRMWRDKNREKLRATYKSSYKKRRDNPETYFKDRLNHKLWHLKHKGKYAEYARRYRAKHRDKVKIQNSMRSLKLKKELVSSYGGYCVCCGETEIRFLTLEHINRDGKLDRKNIGDGVKIYIHYKKLGWPKGRLTILCMNCNFAERYGDPCPHKKSVFHKESVYA